ncbi:MAG: serine/threonine protein kinase [Bacteroidales bacterium]|nr:serine/threonine protein kinase [Bacteroidales bacterium]
MNTQYDSSTSDFVPSNELDISSNYTGLVEISSKGHNCIYKAQRSGKWFVLKGLKKEFRGNPVYENMLLKEFDLMLQMSHTNIIRVYSLENIPQLGLCIVMEFVDGVSLDVFLSKHATHGLRQQLLNELMSAIEYFHQLQIIHRDLKPSNILVTRNGSHIKVIDFGLSDSNQYAILKGPVYTLAYASPEQLNGKEIDCRTDIYSFGRILQELFPRRYRLIAKKCTCLDKEKRYANMGKVVNAFVKRKTALIMAPILLALLMLTGFLYYQKPFAVDSNLHTAQTIAHADTVFIRIDSANVPQSGNMKAMGDISPDFQEKFTESQVKELEHFKGRMKTAMDSVASDFARLVAGTSIKYSQQHEIRRTIMLVKLSICAVRIQLEAPESIRPALEQYQKRLWQKIFDRTNTSDSYPSYYDEYKAGKLTEEQEIQLSAEYDNEAKKLQTYDSVLRKMRARL